MQKRSYRSQEVEEEMNVWSPFTDLMSNAFMVLTLFFILAIVRSAISDRQLNEALQNQTQRESELPVFIISEESPEFKFDPGDAQLPPKLRDYLRSDLVIKIEENLAGRETEYIIQVIGHTDGQQVGATEGNLDDRLEEVARGRGNIQSLQAGSNADLGLMRALAVVKELKSIQQEKQRLQGISFQAYSAAQLFTTDGEFALPNRSDDSNRRRIEIRFSPKGDPISANQP